VFGVAEPEVNVIGTRHGEKLYESLLSREEMAEAEDCGDYYRVPLDGRSLNYGMYVEQGTEGIDEITDHTSHNTRRLTVEEVAEILVGCRRCRRCWRRGGGRGPTSEVVGRLSDTPSRLREAGSGSRYCFGSGDRVGAWLSSSEPWPTHTHPEWRRTFEQARSAGWWFKPLTGHGFGILACSPSDGRADTCAIAVFSTGRGAENVARQTRGKIVSCTHAARTDEQASPSLERAEVLLASAERLLRAARACFASIDRQENALALLDQAQDDLDSAKAEAEFEAAELELSSASARIRLENVDMPADSAPENTAHLALDAAEIRSTTAAGRIANPPEAARAQAILNRCQQVHDTIQQIRRERDGGDH
jgi:hypothetical protein